MARSDEATARFDEATERSDEATARFDEATARSDEATARFDEATARSDEATARSNNDEELKRTSRQKLKKVMIIEICSIWKLINGIHWDFIVDDERGSSFSMIHEDISYNALIVIVL
ncbi:hypothetical protein DY000_02005315 [Brassica cretica]|uniref:Uncharacterized protein n=1 Tax=Brassica cretica TaxID=69181 RepID=A0ABQ7C6G3_BRACR|nr:hypothetical protein DY000_02005315 [Brassica cretica]